MERLAARFMLALLLLGGGCSLTQDFLHFERDAPVRVLPKPEDASNTHYGQVMSFMWLQEEGDEEPVACLAAAAGPARSTSVIRLEDEERLDIERSPTLINICTRAEREESADCDDERRSPDCQCEGEDLGVALGYRSVRGVGEQCLVLGNGEGPTPGIFFRCAMGSDTAPDPLDLPRGNRVTVMAHVQVPRDREVLFVGTDLGLTVLEGTSDEVVAPTTPDGIPTDDGSIAALAALALGDDGPVLVAASVPGDEAVVVAEYRFEEDGGPELVPWACVTSPAEGFGATVRLSRLRDGGGPVYLLASAPDAVELFEVGEEAPAGDVECTDVAAEMTLRCGVVEGRDVECPDEGSQFGVAFDVGNVDDTAEHEVVVGAPGATVRGTRLAGAGFVFRPLREEDEPLAVLVDSEPADGGLLGTGVIMADIAGRPEPILAAPGDTALMMFLCTGVGDEPPGWDSPTNASGSLEDRQCRNPEQ